MWRRKWPSVDTPCLLPSLVLRSAQHLKKAGESSDCFVIHIVSIPIIIIIFSPKMVTSDKVLKNF